MMVTDCVLDQVVVEAEEVGGGARGGAAVCTPELLPALPSLPVPGQGDAGARLGPRRQQQEEPWPWVRRVWRPFRRRGWCC